MPVEELRSIEVKDIFSGGKRFDAESGTGVSGLASRMARGKLFGGKVN